MKNIFNLMIALVLAIQLPAKTIEKTYFFNDFQTQQVGDYQMILAPGAFQTAINGQPLLPWFASKLVLPPGEEIQSVEIIGLDQQTMAGNYQLMPKQYAQPISKGNSGEFIKDQSVYQSTDVFPRTNYVFKTSFWGGHSIGMINYTPFEYIPATGEISYYRQLTVVVHTKTTEKARHAMRLLSKTNNKEIARFVENPEQLSDYSYPAVKDDQYDYLIITPDQFVEELDTLIAHYLQRGIKTQVKSKEEILAEMEGQDAQEKIRNYIIQEYADKGISYVMLAGDVEYIPYRGFYCSVQSSSVYEDDDIPSDLYYSALDGTWNDDGDNKWGEIGEDDLLPEVAVARFSFSNLSELQNMIHKTISYQSSPVLGDLGHPLMAGENLYSNPDTYGSDYLELLIGYHDDNGYETTGIPEDDEFTKLYESNSYWSASDLMNEINAGKNFVHHSGHANENTVMKLYTSDITDSNFSGANGVDHQYTNVYTHGCICGSFDANDCIAEYMVKIQNFAAAFVGNSRYGWFNEGQTEGPSAHIHREFVDALYTDSLHRIGMAHMESKYATAPWVNASGQWEEGALRWCFYDCNVLGDPAMSIWTAEPWEIDVNYPTAVTIGQNSYSLEITSAENPVAGLDAALVKDGVLYGRGSSDLSGHVDMELDPVFTDVGTATLYVSGFNCTPHAYEVNVVPAEGAYVILEECEINDENGNNNAMLDYGETVSLNVSLENVGSEMAGDVIAVLSCNDEDITINNNAANFGDISGNSVLNLEAAFNISVSNSITDMSQIPFEINVTSGDESWMSTLSLVALAPDLNLIGFDLDDASGNDNGRLDPGETVNFIVDIANQGHSLSPELQTNLTTDSDFITINNATQSHTALNADETCSMSYEIVVDENAEIGDIAHIMMDLSGGNYGDFLAYYLTVGLQIEDWESGDFNQYDWYGGGNADWTLTTNNPYEGEYCSQSGSISDNQSSSMNLDLNVLNQDSISFYYKVSSEENYDFLHFYMDENEMDKWSGEEGWIRKAFAVTPGEHTYSWIYTKDMSVSNGDDKGYVDYIVLPAMGIINQISESKLNIGMNFFPNPVKDQAQLQLQSPKDQYLNIQIIDQKGKSIQQFQQHIEEGNQQINFSVKTLDAGVYTIVITGEKGVNYLSFVKM